MPQVSIYLNDKLYTKLLKFQEKAKYGSSGEVIRKSLESFLDENE